MFVARKPPNGCDKAGASSKVLFVFIVRQYFNVLKVKFPRFPLKPWKRQMTRAWSFVGWWHNTSWCTRMLMRSWSQIICPMKYDTAMIELSIVDCGDCRLWRRSMRALVAQSLFKTFEPTGYHAEIPGGRDSWNVHLDRDFWRPLAREDLCCFMRNVYPCLRCFAFHITCHSFLIYERDCHIQTYT